MFSSPVPGRGSHLSFPIISSRFGEDGGEKQSRGNSITSCRARFLGLGHLQSPWEQCWQRGRDIVCPHEVSRRKEADGMQGGNLQPSDGSTRQSNVLAEAVTSCRITTEGADSHLVTAHCVLGCAHFLEATRGRWAQGVFCRNHLLPCAKQTVLMSSDTY